MNFEHNPNTEIKMPPLVRKKRRKLTTAGYLAVIAFSYFAFLWFGWVVK